MKLEIELVARDVSITMIPDTDIDMATFGRYFPESEITPGGSGSMITLQIVKIKLDRGTFRERLRPLGLRESGGPTNLRVTSTAGSGLDAKFCCLRLDPLQEPTECQNLAAQDRPTAELACELMARSNNWFGGRTEDGQCAL